MAEASKDYRWRVGFAAVVAVAAAYILGGWDLLAYPYRLVAFSFRYANAWAEQTSGPVLVRFFWVLEVVAVVWVGGVTLAAFTLCFDDMTEPREEWGLFGFLLAVAALPLVPFIWAAISAFGLPSVAILAEIASLKK